MAGGWHTGKRGEAIHQYKTHPGWRRAHFPDVAQRLAGRPEQQSGQFADRLDRSLRHRDDPTRGGIIDTLHARGGRQDSLLRLLNWRVKSHCRSPDVCREQRHHRLCRQSRCAGRKRDGSPNGNDPVAMDGESYAYHRQSGLAAIPYSSPGRWLFQKMAEGGKCDRHNRRAMDRRETPGGWRGYSNWPKRQAYLSAKLC